MSRVTLERRERTPAGFLRHLLTGGPSTKTESVGTRTGIPGSYTSVVTVIPDEDLVSARVERARHEREMALAAARRLDDEVKRLEYRVAELEADRVALKNRTEEAEAYVAAVKISRPWRLIQSLRGLVGRKW